MKTFNIEIPDGYEIDQEKSTFEKIVFKQIKKGLPKTWEELKEVTGFYVTANSSTSKVEKGDAADSNRNLFVTLEQAEASIALAQLSQLREIYRQGWVPNWKASRQLKYSMDFKEGKYTPYHWRITPRFLTFQSEEVAEKFFNTFADLIEKASPLMS